MSRVYGNGLWIARTDAPWRDLSPEFGKWNTVFKRFREWVKRDVLHLTFNALSNEPDMEYARIDGTTIKVHRHGQGAKGDSKPGKIFQTYFILERVWR